MLFYTVGQSRIFLTMLYAGLLVGLYVTADAALRRLFEAGHLLALMMDLAMGAAAALIIIAGLLLCADGEVRLYSLLGVLCGFLIYMGSVHPLLCHAARCLAGAYRTLARRLARTRFLKKLFK